jgi:hypothetical protein
MSQPLPIFERLIAHARICRQIADASMNVESAGKLERLARECLEAARDADPESWNQMFHRGRPTAA